MRTKRHEKKNENPSFDYIKKKKYEQENWVKV